MRNDLDTTDASLDEDDEEHEGAERSRFAREDWSLRAWLRLLRDLYCTFDRRTLGFSRILLGFLLLMDLVHRHGVWRDMYSDAGVLPAYVNLERPARDVFSIFNGFSSPGELSVLWALMVVNAVCLMVGYRTRVAQVAALLLHGGMNTRVPLIENGGYVVNNLLLLWTLFLPLGDRFSVDALLASLRRRREVSAAELNDRSHEHPAAPAPFVSFAGVAIIVQVGAIYYFNVIHKTGAPWRDGTAVHTVLYISRMATPLAGFLRDRIPDALIHFMTRATMAFEAAIPVLLLSPLARAWARRGVVFAMCTLHLAFGATFVLGPFAWSCAVFSTLFFSREDWEIAAATMRRAHRARVVVFDPRSGGALLVCRVLARLDRFGLLTFAGEEGVPLGVGVRGQASRAGMLADIVEALPLGPAVAWAPRLPGVRGACEAALAAIEARDVSGFFGLRVGGAPGREEPAAPAPAPHVTAGALVVPLLLVAAAVVFAVDLGRPLPGVLMVLGATALGAAGAAWAVHPVLTVAALRRTVAGSLRELLILAMFAGAVNQGLVELSCVKSRIKVPQPEPLRLLAQKLRFYQGWSMFSPNPPGEDGTIVVDALTVDGRHVDPFTRKPPGRGLGPGSLGLDQIWCDYYNRIQLAAHAPDREPLREYLLRFPERTGRPEDALVSGDVYWVRSRNPHGTEKRPSHYEKILLFSFDASTPVSPLASPPAAPSPDVAPMELE